MKNYDSIFNLSSGVTCNLCIRLDAHQSLALTRFNRIAIQGTRQMAADKEAIDCLLILFYV